MYRIYGTSKVSLPEDIRAQGACNTNQLVYHQLGSNAYDVISAVQKNSFWLHELYKRLPDIDCLNEKFNVLLRLVPYAEDLCVLSNSLEGIQFIINNMDFLSEFAVKLDYVINTLTKVEDVLGNIDLDRLERLANIDVDRLEQIIKDSEEEIIYDTEPPEMKGST